MTEDIYTEGSDLIVNFATGLRAKKAMSNTSQRTEYNEQDLASGYPKSEIWTTKDGRKIAIPNLADSHLLNILAYLKDRAEKHRNVIAVRFLMKATAHVMMFDHLRDDEIDNYSEDAIKKTEELRSMNIEELLPKVFPIYSKLYQEAYERKLITDGD